MNYKAALIWKKVWSARKNRTAGLIRKEAKLNTKKSRATKMNNNKRLF